MSFALHVGGLDGQFDCVVFVNNEVVFVLEDSEFARVGATVRASSILPPARQHGVHPAVFARQAADAGVGARLG